MDQLGLPPIPRSPAPIPTPRQQGASPNKAFGWHAPLEASKASANKPKKLHLYRRQLFFAMISLCVALGFLATDIALIISYFKDDKAPSCAWGLIALHAWSFLTHVQFDLMNRGTCRWFPLHLFELKIIYDFWSYVGNWRMNRGKLWSEREFYASKVWESAQIGAPSLLIQTFAIISLDSDSNGPLPVLALIFAGLQTVLDISNFYKYVSVTWGITIVMMVKAMFSVAIRVPVLALFIDYAGSYAAIYFGISYLAGIFIYCFSLFLSRKANRDDPIKYAVAHIQLANLMALNMLFVAFPFAPNHSILDWWRGYQMSEIKSQIENFAMMLTVAIVKHSDYTRDARLELEILYWVAVAFGVILVIASALSFFTVNHKVQRFLLERKVYSSVMIVKLWQVAMHHLQFRRQQSLRPEGMVVDGAEAIEMGLMQEESKREALGRLARKREGEVIAGVANISAEELQRLAQR